MEQTSATSLEKLSLPVKMPKHLSTLKTGTNRTWPAQHLHLTSAEEIRKKLNEKKLGM
jgi:hypothetical protein